MNKKAMVVAVVSMLSVVGCASESRTDLEPASTDSASTEQTGEAASGYAGSADITETTTKEGWAQPIPYKLSAGLFRAQGGVS